MEDINNVQRLGANRNYVWIVYQTTNLVNNKIYIGVHKTIDPNTFDGYLGNGIYINAPCSYMYAKTAFESAVKKYGPSSFRRTTLKVFSNEEDAYNEEARIVDENFLKRSDVYNMILGGKIPYIKKATNPIYQYDLSGNFVREFKSVYEASQKINRASSSLAEACSCNNSCAGFYWSHIKQDKLDMTYYKNLRVYKTLYQYSKDGKFIKEFPSTRSTRYSQAYQSAILGNLVDNKYYFCYIKATNYSVARDIYEKSRIIYQYKQNGSFIKAWKYLDALKQFPHDSINQCIRHKTLSKSGFYWGLQKYKIFNEPIRKQQRTIQKYDIEGNLITTYKNSSECYKNEGKNVYKVLNGLRKSYKGYIYKYA